MIRAIVERTARDCDGMHYRTIEYRMTDEEIADQFGDLDFYSRVIGYMVNVVSEHGTLTVKQYDGMPVVEWSELTEEGFHNESARFERIGE